MGENQLPLDLDDGEMWLPSDIFINDVSPTAAAAQRLRDGGLPFSFTDMDIGFLSNHLSALSLLPPKPKTQLLKLPLSLERFMQPPEFRSANPPARDYVLDFNRDGFGVGCRTYGCRTHHLLLNIPEPLYEFHLTKPTQIQVERYPQQQLARASVLQRQEARLLQFQRNRTSSSRVSTPGGFVRESSGTGVFHPRRVNNSGAGDTAGAAAAGSMKKRGPRNLQVKRTSMRRDQQKQDDCYYHLPPDMGFLKDWTC